MDDDSPIDAPGWAALDHAFSSLYRGQTPHQFTSPTPYELDSQNPLPAITVWECPATDDAPATWHYVSYGLSELFEKTSHDEQRSGMGFELTLAIPRGADETQPPAWGLRLLQALGSYVLQDGQDLDTGHCIGLGQSLDGQALQADRPSGCVCIPDPLLSQMSTPFGRLVFLRLVGLCADELQIADALELEPCVSMMAELSPHAITDMHRGAWSHDPERKKVLHRYRLGLNW